MCGRARCTLQQDDVRRACHRNDSYVRTIHMDRYRPTNNVAPGWGLPVLRRGDSSDGEEVVIQCMKWGLVPSFTKKTEKPDHYKMFNARSETVNEKASFRRLMPKCRCLVAVEGFYEWKKDGSKKQPYYIHFKDGRPLVFAALYDSWVNSEGEELYTFTILTTSASPAFKWLHDRMPVILGGKESTDTWLGGSSIKFDAVLKPYEESDLVWYPVTPAMGKPSFDGPECIKEIHLKVEDKNLISKFFAPKKMKGENEEMKKPKQESSPSKSTQVNVPEALKQEPEPEEIDVKPLTETIPSSTQPSLEEDSTSYLKPKREYEEFSADSLTSVKEKDKHHKSPATKKKKKKDLNGSGSKQPTLFSYFGKS